MGTNVLRKEFVAAGEDAAMGARDLVLEALLGSASA
jgi:hypothetical protein